MTSLYMCVFFDYTTRIFNKMYSGFHKEYKKLNVLGKNVRRDVKTLDTDLSGIKHDRIINK